MIPRSLRPRLALGAALLGAAATSAAAFTVTRTVDAFDLATALTAPAPLLTLTGNFTDASLPLTGQRPAGTFTGGAPLLGFESGIVLSTGDVAQLFGRGDLTAAFDFGTTPLPDTAALLDAVPGTPGAHRDPVRLSLTAMLTDLTVGWLNFSFAYGSNEPGLNNDRFGLFVDGQNVAFLVGDNPIDQFNPLVADSFVLGLARMIYPDANSLLAPFVTLSIPVGPGSVVALDLVLADTIDGDFDTAVFLGDFRGSADPQGIVVPEPSTWALLGGLAALGAAFVLRRRR